MAEGFFTKTIESLGGLLTGLLDLIPGLILAINYELIAKNIWAAILIPPLISFRGSTLGVFIGRYSTGLHLGTMKTTITRNTRFFYSVFLSTWILNIIGSSLIIAVIYALSLIYGIHLNILNVVLMFSSAMLISNVIIFIAIMMVSAFTYRLGLDPDYMLYPITSTLADIIVVGTFISILYMWFEFGHLLTLYVLTAVFYASAIITKLIPMDWLTFKKTISESLLSLLIIVILVCVTGMAFGEISKRVSEYPQIYLTYPSLITTVGDSGSIVGSALTTRLHLGTIGAGWSLVPRSLSIVLPTLCAYEAVMAIYALIAYLYVENPLGSIVVFLSGNLAFVMILLITIIVVNLTFQLGLDPDHFVNPFISTLADNMTTLAILFTIVTLIA